MTTSRKRAAAVQSRRLQHAREIIAAHDLWGKLTYMDNCPTGYREGGGDPSAMKRYMIITSTDGGEDGWVDMKDTIGEVEDLVRGLVTDEWGLAGVWDLDQVSEQPFAVELSVRVTYPRKDRHHG